MSADKKSSPAFHASFYGPRYWFTWLGLGFFKLLASLPLSVSMPLGAGLGRLFLVVAPSRRKITEVNVALCFPELNPQQQQQLVRDILRSIGISVVETSIAFWGNETKTKDRYSVKGLEHVTVALEQGRGVLLVGCHLTTLDLAGRMLASHLKFDVLYRKDPNPLLAYKIAEARGRFAGSAIVRNDTRQMIKNLRKGHVVWYAPDQDYGSKYSVFAPFFGINAATIVGTSRIAEMGKATVLPFSHYRTEGGHYELEFGAPLTDFPSGDDVADATRINQVIEKIIRRYPEQYLWVHRRFKTRPPGEARLYANKR